MPSKRPNKELEELRNEVMQLKEEVSSLRDMLSQALSDNTNTEAIDMTQFIEAVTGGQSEDTFYCEDTGRYEFLDSFLTPRQAWWPKWL